MGEIIRKQGLLIDSQKRTWEEAIGVCGDLMVSLGSVTPEYTDAMIQAVRDMGPYVVIAPRIAFAHAASGKYVNENDLVLTVFKEPVIFNCDNDPVHLMFGICAIEAGSHLEILQKLAEVLEDEKADKLIKAASVDELYELINQ